MAKLKERHHWWPENVSRLWGDAEGCVNWLLPDGEERRAPPKNFGVIGNGHIIKVAVDGPSPWDHSFESEFERADNNFPSVIEWLQSLPQTDRMDAALKERFVSHSVTDDQLGRLAECIISLAVRSPMNRASAVGLAEHFRGSLPEKERNAIMGMNMLNTQRKYVQDTGDRGKYVVLHSPDREFTYGDGFFHNVQSPASHSIHHLKILVPITPRLAVLLSRPASYMVEPRLMTLQLKASETDQLNFVQQVYASDMVFYRNDAPAVSSEFAAGRHMRFTTSQNPADELFDHIPGVPARDRAMERLFREAQGRNSGTG